MKIVIQNKQVQFHTEGSLLRIELDDIFKVEDTDHKEVYVMVTWSQHMDNKYLEDVCVLNDIVNQTIWKDFPYDVWLKVKDGLVKWLHKAGISFQEAKLEL
jgi:hypothetical protein